MHIGRGSRITLATAAAVSILLTGCAGEEKPEYYAAGPGMFFDDLNDDLLGTTDHWIAGRTLRMSLPNVLYAMPQGKPRPATTAVVVGRVTSIKTGAVDVDGEPTPWDDQNAHRLVEITLDVEDAVSAGDDPGDTITFTSMIPTQPGEETDRLLASARTLDRVAVLLAHVGPDEWSLIDTNMAVVDDRGRLTWPAIEDMQREGRRWRGSIRTVDQMMRQARKPEIYAPAFEIQGPIRNFKKLREAR